MAASRRPLFLASLFAAPVAGVCNTTWCTSPNGVGGTDCFGGIIGEPCGCSSGTARILPDQPQPLTAGAVGQLYFYEYTCCDDDDEPNTGESCGLSACDLSHCTSPGLDGTSDCYVDGGEACSCSNGLLGETSGLSITFDGDTYLQYGCCPVGTAAAGQGGCDDGASDLQLKAVAVAAAGIAVALAVVVL
jgi:hypothetical protein